MKRRWPNRAVLGSYLWMFSPHDKHILVIGWASKVPNPLADYHSVGHEDPIKRWCVHIWWAGENIVDPLNQECDALVVPLPDILSGDTPHYHLFPLHPGTWLLHCHCSTCSHFLPWSMQPLLHQLQSLLYAVSYWIELSVLCHTPKYGLVLHLGFCLLDCLHFLPVLMAISALETSPGF